MHCRKYISIYQWLSTAIFVLLMWATTAAQVTTAKPANPNITAPTPQRHEPAGGQRPASNTPSIANAPPPNTALTMNPGDVEGFVYWDARHDHSQTGWNLQRTCCERQSSRVTAHEHDSNR